VVIHKEASTVEKRWIVTFPIAEMHHFALALTCVAVIFALCQANLQEQYEKLQRRTLLSAPVTDYDTYTFTPSTDGKNHLASSHVVGNYVSTGRPYSAWFATFHPSSFSFLAATKEGCTKLERTSKSAVEPWHEACAYATNGGFFNMAAPVNGTYCIGNLYSLGELVQLDATTGYKRTQFGITKDGRMLAGIMDAATVAAQGFAELMTGYGWMVRNGVTYVNSTQDIPSASTAGFVLEKAPRTAVGVMKDGQMGLLEIDGEEDIDAGPDLYELAELAVALGFDTLMNVDGGGSSVSVKDGKVISHPTCDDTPVECERADASLTCVRRDAV